MVTAQAARFRRAALGVAVTALCGALTAFHPLHTSLTEMSYDGASRTLQVQIRVFASDLQAVTARKGAPPVAQVSDAQALAYVNGNFALSTGRTRLPLRWCGMRRGGDLFWICLRAPAPSGTQGVQVWNRMMFELFEDQINIVQVNTAGRRRSMIFTRGDGPRPLP
ncbi:MAG: hypothetical protein JO040_04610 [Gemmatimonadetes bacterium]|nr:hypothetical protein [Gemmatimonadota bacterium]